MLQKSKKTKAIKFFLICFVAISLIFLSVNFYQNQHVQIHEITITSELTPHDFTGYRIAHISDLHNAEIGDGNEKLLSAIKESSPDIIVITGDIIDSRKTDVQVAIDFINKSSEIAPVYYVTGNHESRVGTENHIDNFPLNESITILHNENVLLQKGESKIQLIGVDDPNFINSVNSTDYMNSSLAEYKDNEHFKILLSHRPELFEAYIENNMNVVFSGHAHGGQIRLPFIGGVFAPHQGLFPEYDSGIYTESNTNMIVSRGIGNSLFPFRVNNPPEIIIVTLEK